MASRMQPGDTADTDPTPEGLASNCFEFACRVNESLVNAAIYDRELARAVVKRWTPAWCRGYLVLYATDGNPHGVFDDPNSGFNGCTFA